MPLPGARTRARCACWFVCFLTPYFVLFDPLMGCSCCWTWRFLGYAYGARGGLGHTASTQSALGPAHGLFFVSFEVAPRDDAFVWLLHSCFYFGLRICEPRAVDLIYPARPPRLAAGASYLPPGAGRGPLDCCLPLILYLRLQLAAARNRVSSFCSFLFSHSSQGSGAAGW